MDRGRDPTSQLLPRQTLSRSSRQHNTSDDKGTVESQAQSIDGREGDQAPARHDRREGWGLPSRPVAASRVRGAKVVGVWAGRRTRDLQSPKLLRGWRRLPSSGGKWLDHNDSGDRPRSQAIGFRGVWATFGPRTELRLGPAASDEVVASAAHDENKNEQR